MFEGLRYADDGRLLDDTGHVWRRVQDWVEPAEATRMVAAGVRFAVQHCLQPPRRTRPERFARDVLPYMMTLDRARTYWERRSWPTVMVGELWRSDRDGDALVFVETAPAPRGKEELRDDWG